MVTSTTTIDQNAVVVVMVPLPLQGHLNQLLHFSRLISAHNIPVHFVSTTVHGGKARLRLEGWNPNIISNIFFHQYYIQPFESPPPNPNSNTMFPAHLYPLCDTATHLRRPVASLLRKLAPTTRRLVVIHDSLMGSVVQDFVCFPNAETYTFHSVSAFSIALYTSEKVREEIQKLMKPQTLTKDLVSFEGCFTSEFKKFIATQHEYTKLSSGRIYNTCKVLEQPILDLLEIDAQNKKRCVPAHDVPNSLFDSQHQKDRSNKTLNSNKLLWALGPFNPLDVKRSKLDQSSCLKWLDKQASNSVIFVSFGTTTLFSQEQINEIAIGLEESNQKFVWVVRDADDDRVSREIKLPVGYENRVKDQGSVVRKWAPQLEILSHRSIGGFMSHCGWNSCIESLSMGVPIAAWPIHSDQPNNAVLVTEVLKAGLVVKEWCQREQVVAAASVENVVRRLMGSKEGEDVRKRAAAMSCRIRNSVCNGGLSQIELESFIAHITRN
ncbi:zeatin O-glucosyltransferase-like protein [Tanacetum coccineum]